MKNKRSKLGIVMPILLSALSSVDTVKAEKVVPIDNLSIIHQANSDFNKQISKLLNLDPQEQKLQFKKYQRYKHGREEIFKKIISSKSWRDLSKNYISEYDAWGYEEIFKSMDLSQIDLSNFKDHPLLEGLIDSIYNKNQFKTLYNGLKKSPRLFSGIGYNDYERSTIGIICEELTGIIIADLNNNAPYLQDATLKSLILLGLSETKNGAIYIINKIKESSSNFDHILSLSNGDKIIILSARLLYMKPDNLISFLQPLENDTKIFPYILRGLSLSVNGSKYIFNHIKRSQNGESMVSNNIYSHLIFEYLGYHLPVEMIGYLNEQPTNYIYKEHILIGLSRNNPGSQYILDQGLDSLNHLAKKSQIVTNVAKQCPQDSFDTFNLSNNEEIFEMLIIGLSKTKTGSDIILNQLDTDSGFYDRIKTFDLRTIFKNVFLKTGWGNLVGKIETLKRHHQITGLFVEFGIQNGKKEYIISEFLNNKNTDNVLKHLAIIKLFVLGKINGVNLDSNGSGYLKLLKQIKDTLELTESAQGIALVKFLRGESITDIARIDEKYNENIEGIMLKDDSFVYVMEVYYLLSNNNNLDDNIRKIGNWLKQHGINIELSGNTEYESGIFNDSKISGTYNKYLIEISFILGRNLYFSGASPDSINENSIKLNMETWINLLDSQSNKEIIKGRNVVYGHGKETWKDADTGERGNSFFNDTIKEYILEDKPNSFESSSSKKELKDKLAGNNGPITFVFNGHGDKNNLSLGGNENLGYKELGDIWLKRSKGEEDIIILGSCYNQNFIRKFISYLQENGKQAPLIIGTSEFNQFSKYSLTTDSLKGLGKLFGEILKKGNGSLKIIDVIRNNFLQLNQILVNPYIFINLNSGIFQITLADSPNSALLY